MSLKDRRLHPQYMSCFHQHWIGTHFGLLNLKFTKTLFHKTVFFGTYFFTDLFKTSQISKCSHLSLKSLLLNSSNFLLSNLKLLKLTKCRGQFTLKMFSLKLNTKPYSRLDKEVANFKEHKNKPVVPHTIKCFHHQDKKKHRQQQEMQNTHLTLDME